MAARSIVIALLSLLAGCASQPPRNIYVLNSAADSAASTAVAATASVPQVVRVLVPDYLDTTDILLRVGQHELQASHTGRWGERLSAGITHALRTDLPDRLPKDTALPGQSADRSVRRVLVTVDSFDVWNDGHCVLKASWSLETVDRRVVKDGRGSFTVTAGGGATGSDAAIVSNMANAVSQLADAIASAVREP